MLLKVVKSLAMVGSSYASMIAMVVPVPLVVEVRL